MNARALKQRLAGGQTVFGTMFDYVVNPQWAGIAGNSTLDYVVIDAEHGSRDRLHLATLSIAFKAAGLATIIRIAAPDPTLIAIALDAGADGVLVPYCEKISDVRDCVATAKLHPLKGEYLERAVDIGQFPSETSERYLKALHEDHLIIIGIESEPALDRLDEILDVGNIDGLFVGPNDLSTSLGAPDELEGERYVAALHTIVEKAESRGVAVMIHHDEPEDSVRAVKIGARFVLHSYDGGVMMRAYRKEFGELRRLVSELRGETFRSGDRGATCRLFEARKVAVCLSDNPGSLP